MTKKFTVNSELLINAMYDAFSDDICIECECIRIPLGENKYIDIDLLTSDILYTDDEEGDEIYLDTITFTE